jgi:hypothetical protein
MTFINAVIALWQKTCDCGHAWARESCLLGYDTVLLGEHFEGLWCLHLHGLASLRRMENFDVRSFMMEHMNILE